MLDLTGCNKKTEHFEEVIQERRNSTTGRKWTQEEAEQHYRRMYNVWAKTNLRQRNTTIVDLSYPLKALFEIKKFQGIDFKSLYLHCF